MEWIRKHKKVVFGIGFVALLFLIVFAGQKRQATGTSVYEELEDVPREGVAKESRFYEKQLTQKEAEVYLFLKEQLQTLKGGIVTLPEPIDGKEYERIVTALEYDRNPFFYGFVDIPMTEDNVYVLQKEKDPARITEDKIEKVVVFLSCAKGIDQPGEFDEEGILVNAEEIGEELSVNDEEKEAKIRMTGEETEMILEEIVAGIPEGNGEKATADYFLKWLDENLTVADDTAAKAKELDHMGEMLEEVYPYNHLAALTIGKASVIGYAKILTELFERAGMESHVVMGRWNSQWKEEMYVLCAVSIDGQTVYIDASGAMKSSLGGSRWLSEEEALNRMIFAEYYEYES